MEKMKRNASKKKTEKMRQKRKASKRDKRQGRSRHRPTRVFGVWKVGLATLKVATTVNFSEERICQKRKTERNANPRGDTAKNDLPSDRILTRHGSRPKVQGEPPSCNSFLIQKLRPAHDDFCFFLFFEKKKFLDSLLEKPVRYRLKHLRDFLSDLGWQDVGTLVKKQMTIV